MPFRLPEWLVQLSQEQLDRERERGRGRERERERETNRQIDKYLEPVDGAAVDEGRKHAKSAAESITDGTHCQDNVKILFYSLYEVVIHRQRRHIELATLHRSPPTFYIILHFQFHHCSVDNHLTWLNFDLMPLRWWQVMMLQLCVL